VYSVTGQVNVDAWNQRLNDPTTWGHGFDTVAVTSSDDVHQSLSDAEAPRQFTPSILPGDYFICQSATLVFDPAFRRTAAVPWLPWIRRSIRFSLRTLLIATTLVAVGLGLIVAMLRWPAG
jgi:hypothetical protein